MGFWEDIWGMAFDLFVMAVVGIEVLFARIRNINGTVGLLKASKSTKTRGR